MTTTNVRMKKTPSGTSSQKVRLSRRVTALLYLALALLIASFVAWQVAAFLS